ncbi:DUF3352 domain-containing protein [Nodosilinea sp. LEGE 07088]|uniref:DUF3352 domain-containing protein n=1 Tax=Nodosilinea sp. LEGE 07088 TaxID=2777968 RepID=UPI0018816869|nr:DUF3352 domain-containing protein [Nodosilinea sp. LEGE 07088]MBE9137742.1 DUF3352 domain-containing protein [Nodosilinea sp. LEGE 07088]
MKFRSFIRPLAIAAGLVLVLGVGLLGRFTLNTPLYLIERGGLAQPQALQFVPKQSTLVASVLVRPDRLASLWEYLAAPSQRQEARRDQASIEQVLLANTGLNYDRDLQPWLGDEITGALVTADLDQNPANGLMPGYLAVLSCQDPQAAQAALELYWQNRAIAGDALTFEDFSGNRLIYARPRAQRAPAEDSAQLATALVANRYLLAANHPEVLRQALTAAQSNDLNLQSDRRYKTALGKLPPTRVGLLALNLPALGQWLNPTMAKGQGLGALGAIDDQVGWGLMSWQLTRQGLVGHTALLAAQGHRLHAQQPSNTSWAAIAPYLPDSLAVAAVGSDLLTLGQALQPLLAIVSPDETTPPLDRLLDEALGAGATALVKTGVDGAYGVGLSASTPGTTLDWLIVAPQSETLTANLEALSDLARHQGLGVGTLDLQGTPTIAWTRLSLPQRSGSQPLQVKAAVAGLNAQVDQYEVLTASPATLDMVLNPAVRQRPSWWQQVAEVSGPSTGYIHIDWPQVQGNLTTRLRHWQLWSTAAQPALKHLRQITLVGSDRSDAMQIGRILVQLSNQ